MSWMGSRRKLRFLVRANWMASSSFSKTFCLRFAASRYFTTNFRCGWFASLPGACFLLLWVKLRSCVGWLYAYTDYLYLPKRVMTCADREIRFAECQAFFCNKCVTSVEFIKFGSMRFSARTCVID